ncbi:DUF805 domain-containing protein [bacterium]|nr:DUF805 domain-containing protein [bacterium]
MSFSESIVSVWNKAYRCFEGRARRSEYWFFFLFSLILSVIPIVNIIAGIALLIPGLSVAVRRLHDTGRTGWWLLLGCIPLIGTIILIIFFLIDSDPGDNEYGPNPKGIGPGPGPEVVS